MAAVDVAYVEVTNQAQPSRPILEASATDEQTLQATYQNQTRKLTAET